MQGVINSAGASHSSNSNDQIRLFCFVLGHSENSFSVKVEKDKMVEDLRDPIINKAKLTTDRIQLFKPPQPLSTPELQAVQAIHAEWQALYSEESLQQHFASPLQLGIHIVVQLLPHRSPTLKRSLEDQSTTEGEQKRSRVSVEPEDEQEKMNLLYKQIISLSEDPTKYSDPQEVFDLPFPSMNVIPPRFLVSGEGKISYMGRECFNEVWTMFKKVKSKYRQRKAFYFYGGKGSGKSYIFAALACFLIRRGEQVVYLPDCRAMLAEPLEYIRKALALAFIRDTSKFEQILACQTVESLVDFCVKYQKNGELSFIVDQQNALDLELDEVEVSAKEALRKVLRDMSVGHITMMSASANYKTHKLLQTKLTGVEMVPLLGGMTSVEMEFWWKRHDFKAFSKADKERVEDLTGCIPLLLNPFVMHSSKILESLEPQIWNDKVLDSVRREILDFAKAKKVTLTQVAFRDEFVDAMRNCLQHRPIGDSGPHIDHRYFYIDLEGRGRYSCGLARQAITEFLRRHGEESLFLGSDWYDTLEAFKNNPSVIGFTAKQLIISRIASTGLHLDKDQLPPAKIFPFDDKFVRLSKDRPSTYYVPLRFNQKAVDTLFVSIDHRKKTAHLVPIQITVAKQHNDSEAAFFADLSIWLRGLEDFKVKKTFVWIHDGIRGCAQVKEKLIKLRNRSVMVNPDYTVLWVDVAQVDVELANTLTRIETS